MLFRWKKEVLVIWLMWCSKERLLSKMTQRLRMCVEGESGVVDGEAEVMSGFGEGLVTDDEHVRFCHVAGEVSEDSKEVTR